MERVATPLEVSRLPAEPALDPHEQEDRARLGDRNVPLSLNPGARLRSAATGGIPPARVHTLPSLGQGWDLSRVGEEMPVVVPASSTPGGASLAGEEPGGLPVTGIGRKRTARESPAE